MLYYSYLTHTIHIYTQKHNKLKVFQKGNHIKKKISISYHSELTPVPYFFSDSRYSAQIRAASSTICTQGRFL